MANERVRRGGAAPARGGGPMFTMTLTRLARTAGPSFGRSERAVSWPQ